MYIERPRGVVCNAGRFDLLCEYRMFIGSSGSQTSHHHQPFFSVIRVDHFPRDIKITSIAWVESGMFQ